MSTPNDARSKRDEESLEETLAKLVFLNGFISKAKEERARLFEKIAQWHGYQAESEPKPKPPTTAITKEAQSAQVADTELASPDANNVDIIDAEGGMNTPRIIPDRVKARANAITTPDVDNKALTPASSVSNSPTGTDHTLPSDETSWVIKDPPSPQRFSGTQDDHGVSMCIPACMRGIFVNEERETLQDSKISADKPSAPDIFEDRDAIPFRAIVDIDTAYNFVASSFIAANVTSNDTFFGDQVPNPTPRSTNRVQFTFSSQHRQEAHDNTTPQLAISGHMGVPIEIEGHLFWLDCYICEGILAKDEHAEIFPVILGSRFLGHHFLQIQSAEGGWLIRLPPLAPPEFTYLPVYTHGCRVDVATPDTEDCPVQESTHGYGIHFPSLPAGWDVHAAARPETPCIVTTELAELFAVARALHFVYDRLIRPYRNRVGCSLGKGVRCKKIIIRTESNDAVSSFHKHLLKWRANGFKTAKKKPVINVDAWKSVAYYQGLLFMLGITVHLIKVSSEDNEVAKKLARMGALNKAGHGHEPSCIPRKIAMDGTESLIHCTPDGPFIVERWPPPTADVDGLVQDGGKADQEAEKSHQDTAVTVDITGPSGKGKDAGFGSGWIKVEADEGNTTADRGEKQGTEELLIPIA